MNAITNILFITLLMSAFSCCAHEYAIGGKVSWIELQKKEFNFVDKLNRKLSDQCPKDLSFYKEKPQTQKFSYIFFTDYYWTEYVDDWAALCIIKYTDKNRKESDASVLSKLQSSQLLKAEKYYGFTEKSTGVLFSHMNLQRLAIREFDSLKYGGMDHVFKFLKNNQPEIEFKKSEIRISKAGYAIIDAFSPVDYLERSYSKETLSKLKKEVQENPPHRIANGKYPFITIENLIKEAKLDVRDGVANYLEVLAKIDNK